MSKSKQHQSRPTADAKPANSTAGSTSRREQLRVQQAAEAQRARTMRIVLAAAIALGVLIVAVVGVVLYQNHQRAKEQEQLRASEGQIVPPSANESKSGLVYANSTANSDKPLVEVYMDYQCPACAQASALVEPNLEQLASAGEIRLTYHTLFGLDRNFPGNNSYRAALAATCADTQGAFAAYSHVVYQNQPKTEGAGWTDDQLRGSFAEQAGLAGEQLTAFQACYDAKSTSDFVDGIQKARPDYVSYTPYFAVNGNEMKFTQELTTADGLKPAIDRAAG